MNTNIQTAVVFYKYLKVFPSMIGQDLRSMKKIALYCVVLVKPNLLLVHLLFFIIIRGKLVILTILFYE